MLLKGTPVSLGTISLVNQLSVTKDTKRPSPLRVHRLYTGVYNAGTDKKINTMDEPFGKSFAKAQQLHGISLNSFIASISLSAVLFSLEVLVFLIIRKHFPDL
jgi:hypothetical protein